DVYVRENIPAQSMEDLLDFNIYYAQLGDDQLGDFPLGDALSYYSDLFDCFQLGVATLGDTQLAECSYNQKVANYIDYQKDIFFNIGNNYKSTFLIGGGYPGEFADVDSTRREELRQLVLRIKPVQSIGYMLINYI
ncbi:MAG: hypothetical protein KAU20_01765, partial [Nanoarchaeota archaeon]|nr:hypothetical protein [Nanoarchaeota archaeon]